MTDTEYGLALVCAMLAMTVIALYLELRDVRRERDRLTRQHKRFINALTGREDGSDE